MIRPSDVSACLVTRGNVDLGEILAELANAGIEDVVVWNNAERENLSCYGRYAAIAEAKNEYIWHQDDDLVSPVLPLLDRYEPGRDGILANNRVDEEWPLTAIGCVFQRDLADCFDQYTSIYGQGPDFHRICDVVFAYANPYRRVVLGYRDLAWASDPASSMYLEADHMTVRFEARARTLALPVTA